MKKILALALTLALTLSAAPAFGAGIGEQFPGVKTYPGYADVPAGSWYESYAKICYETDLITGTDAGFAQGKTMSLAEGAVIAARLHSTISGKAIPMADPKVGETLHWAFSYVQYLESLGITGLTALDAPTTRGKFLSLLAEVVPAELLPPVNKIETLPDVTDAHVLRFYNSGILTGTDQYGTFQGEKTLTRAEAAAMVARIVRPALRTPFVPMVTPDKDPTFLAAHMDPELPLLRGASGTITAGIYLPRLVNQIYNMEQVYRDKGLTFNWNDTYGTETVLEYVEREALAQSRKAAGIPQAEKLTESDPFRLLNTQEYYANLLSCFT